MKKLLLTFIAISTLSKLNAQSNTSDLKSIANNGKAWASLYQQRAAEYRALCFQAYNIAKLRLDAAINKPHHKPLAVVTDIDETLLDNSPYNGQRAINNLEFDDKTWKEWTAKGIADTVPGAVAFFRYASKRGVAIFYITNRDEDEKIGTKKNLQYYHLPNIDDAHLLLRSTKSSKEDRRQTVLKSHQIILLCGDNLPDFDMRYDDHPSEEKRMAATEKLSKKFGDKYIIIPNMSYGDFEGALFDYNYKLPATQKDSIIKARLKTIN